MKHVLLGAVSGLALAAGILGIQIPAVGGEHQPDESGSHSSPRVESLPPSEPSHIIASHSDVNTQEVKVGLNGNLIAGRSTIICTGDATLAPKLREAVTEWNTKLTGLGFDAFDLHVKSNLAQCNSLSGVHVVVRKGDCPNDGACYWKISGDEDTPPRQTFRRDGKSFAEIEYESAVIRKSTFMHELGHVLGLSDYTDCDSLRVQAGGSAVEDPDPNNSHYSLMYNAKDRDCRPLNEATITDRDLRDLYEAYHVGPVTRVRVQSREFAAPGERPIAVNGGIVSVSLRWADRVRDDLIVNGMDDLAHNASKVVVFAHYPVNGWSDDPVGDFDIPASGSTPHHLIVDAPRKSFPNPIVKGQSLWEWPDKFRIVGLTQGDIRWIAGKAGLTGNAANWDFDREFVNDQGTAATADDVTYTEGDPAYVSGRLVDSSDAAIANPRSVSASISPRYCWTGERLSISNQVFGGIGKVSFLVKNDGQASYSAATTAACSATAGTRTPEVRGEWRSSSSSLLHHREIDDLRMLAIQRPAAAPTLEFTAVSDCGSGDKTTNVSFRASGGVGTRVVWLEQQHYDAPLSPASSVTTISAKCPSGGGRPRVHGFVLDTFAQGSAATTLQRPSKVEAEEQGRIGARLTRVHWTAVGGAHGYEIERRSAGSGSYTDARRVPSGVGAQIFYGGLGAGRKYDFRVRARHGRAVTEWRYLTNHTVAAVVPIAGPRVDYLVAGYDEILVGGQDVLESASGSVQPSLPHTVESSPIINVFYETRLEERVSLEVGFTFVTRATHRVTLRSGERSWRHRFENAAGSDPIVRPDTPYRIGVRKGTDFLVTKWDFGEVRTFAHEAPRARRRR